jgi:hypothetical protein
MIVSAETQLCKFFQEPKCAFRSLRIEGIRVEIFIGDALTASLPKSIFIDAARGVALGVNYVQDLL